MNPEIVSGPSRDIEVWLCPIDIDAGELDRCRRELSEDEMARGQRFSFPIHRTRYIACRSALRRLIAGRLGIEPCDVIFEYGPQGKPALNSRRHQSDLMFNLSHSGAVALIALAHGIEVGVDIEDCERELEYEAVARLVFSSTEQRLLLSTHGLNRARFFFRCWTAREAYLKCTGEGLAHDPERFSLYSDVGDEPRLLHSGGVLNSPVQVRRLFVPEPFAAAVVAQEAITGVVVKNFYQSGCAENRRFMAPAESATDPRCNVDSARLKFDEREGWPCMC